MVKENESNEEVYEQSRTEKITISGLKPAEKEKWKRAVRQQHGSFRGVSSAEGRKALLEWADMILQGESVSNREIARRVDELQAMLGGGGSHTESGPQVLEKKSQTGSEDSENVHTNTGSSTTEESVAESVESDKETVETLDVVDADNIDDVDWESFRGVYKHDVAIDPSATTDWDGLVKQKTATRMPVVAGQMRWMVDQGPWNGDGSVKQKDITKWIQDTWDASRPTAYSYRDNLVTKGVLFQSTFLTLSADDDVVKGMRVGMQPEGGNWYVEDDITKHGEDRWDGVAEHIIEVASSDVTVECYFFGREAYETHVRESLKTLIVELAAYPARYNLKSDTLKSASEGQHATAVRRYVMGLIDLIEDDVVDDSGVEKARKLVVQAAQRGERGDEFIEEFNKWAEAL